MVSGVQVMSLQRYNFYGGIIEYPYISRKCRKCNEMMNSLSNVTYFLMILILSVIIVTSFYQISTNVWPIHALQEGYVQTHQDHITAIVHLGIYLTLRREDVQVRLS